HSRRGRLSPEFVFVTLSIVGTGCLVFALAYARANGIPRIESHQLGAVTYGATCRGDTCAVDIAAQTTSGKPTSIPEASVLTFGCGSATPRFTQYERTLSARIRLTQPCTKPRLVAAWPTVMGLPPGSFELGAVKVNSN